MGCGRPSVLCVGKPWGQGAYWVCAVWFPRREVFDARRVGSGLEADPGEIFAVAVGALDGGFHESPPLPAGLGFDEVLDLVAGFLVQGGVADDAAFADLVFAKLELGLDQDDGVAAWAQRGEGGWQHEREGDEGDIGDDEVHVFADVFGLEVADVVVLPGDDAGIAAQLPDELICAHVEGEDLAGAALQEAIGEASGARADIKADTACGIDAEVIERAFELEATTADVFGSGPDADGGVFGHELAGLGDGGVIDEHVPGEDEAFALLAGVAEAASDEKVIEPLLHAAW